MIDAPLRRILTAPLAWGARVVDRSWITPNRITLVGLLFGLASAGLAAAQLWGLALATWLVCRVFDGLDGALARRRRATGDNGGASEAGGFIDIVADFAVYGATVVGVAVGAWLAFDAPWWPFMLVLLAYYINGAAFLAFSSIAERTGKQIDDGRSLSFLGKIAEGTETIVVHSLWLILPWFAWQLAIVWAAFVFVSAAQRVVSGIRILR